MEIPYCEICGEDHVTCQTEECGMCDDCYANHVREALQPLLGKVCASVSRQSNGYLQVCCAPHGVEHDH